MENTIENKTREIYRSMSGEEMTASNEEIREMIRRKTRIVLTFRDGKPEVYELPMMFEELLGITNGVKGITPKFRKWIETVMAEKQKTSRTRVKFPEVVIRILKEI